MIPSANRRDLIQILAFVRELIGSIDDIEIALPGKPETVVHARDKLLAEVSLFYSELLRSNAADLRLQDICREGLEDVVALHDLARMTRIIHRFPQAALAFGPVALALKVAGHANHPICELVCAAVQSPFYLSKARPDFRELEALWLKTQLTGEAADVCSLPKRGLLFRRTHSIFLSREDLYAKTHSAMYLTDFGRCKLEEGFDHQDLSTSLDHDLAWAFSNADWDLVGELLMAACYCQVVPSPWQLTCNAAIDGVFQHFGFVPAPTFDTDYANCLSNANRECYTRFHAYHSTVVYGLLLLAERCKTANGLSSFQQFDGLPLLISKALTSVPSMSFSVTGVNPDWFTVDTARELSFPDDLIAEVVLLRACDLSSLAIATHLATGLVVSDKSSPLADTVDVLKSHQSALSV